MQKDSMKMLVILNINLNILIKSILVFENNTFLLALINQKHSYALPGLQNWPRTSGLPVYESLHLN